AGGPAWVVPGGPAGAGRGGEGPVPRGSAGGVFVIAPVAAGSTRTKKMRVVAWLGPIPPGAWPKLFPRRPSANGMVPPASGTATPSSAVLFGDKAGPAGLGRVSVPLVPVAGRVSRLGTLSGGGRRARAGEGVVFLLASLAGLR